MKFRNFEEDNRRKVSVKRKAQGPKVRTDCITCKYVTPASNPWGSRVLADCREEYVESNAGKRNLRAGDACLSGENVMGTHT